MEFKDRLRSLRKEKQLTQVKLGELLSYGYTTIANYESGRNQPSIEDLKKLASIFDVSMDYLLGVSDVRLPYVTDDDTAKFDEFRRRYSVLSEGSKDHLLMYMQFLAEQERHQNDAYEETEPKRKVLRVAQEQEKYE